MSFAVTRMAIAAALCWAVIALLIGSPGWAFLVSGCCAGLASAGLLVPCVVRAGQWHSARAAQHLLRGIPPLLGRRLVSVVTLAGLAAAAAAFSVGINDSVRSPPLLHRAAQEHTTVEIEFAIAEKATSVEPSSAMSGPSWGRGDSEDQPRPVRVAIDITELRFPHEELLAVSIPAMLFAELNDADHLPLGAVYRTEVLLVLAEPGDDAAALAFARTEVEQREGPSPLLAWADGLRQGFLRVASALPGDGGDLLPGLAVGETSLVRSELDEAMTTVSLSHLTAVSGANCAVIVALTMALLRCFLVPLWLRVAGSLAALGLFVVLVTPEPSVVRAGLMAAVVLASQLWGRRSSGLAVLALVVIVLLVVDPWIARDYGFGLSVLASGGLLTLAAPLGGVFGRWMPHPLAEAIAIPTAAQLACQPLLLTLAPVLSLYGIVANLITEPFAPIATMLGLLACLLEPVLPAVAVIPLWLGWLPSSWIAGVAAAVAPLPFASIPWADGWLGVGTLVVATAALLTLLLGRSRLPASAVVLSVAVLVVSSTVASGMAIGQRFGTTLAVPASWSYAACDIGQGDAVLVRSGDAVALIDTGPDEERLGRCLDSLGIGRIELLVLTHFDLDHIGGVAAVIGRVDRVFSGVPENGGDQRLLDSLDEGGAELVMARAGMEGFLGEAPWRVLWPPAPPESRRAAGSAVLSGNDASIVIEFLGDGTSGVFLGDLGETAQRSLLAQRSIGTGYEMVKVAHHGSADQSAALYERIAATIGLVSVGVDNNYGHPTNAVLDILDTAGTTAIRTDRCGLIVLARADDDWTIWTERDGDCR